MRHVVHFMWLTTIGFIPAFFTNYAHAQARACDVTCTLDTKASSYVGVPVSRASITNARGSSSPIVARSSVAALAANSGSTVIGSQSYNYVIPILRIPGRAGKDLVLNLYYNSRIWNVDTVHRTATFNADRDFPSYGFRLDLGFLEYDLATNTYIFTEGDDTKHALPGPNFDSTDGTFIHYNNANGFLTYKDGTTLGFNAVPSQQGQVHPTLLRPYWTKDTNGNIISIEYVDGHDQLVSGIVNTQGKRINFNYNASNQLTSLTQAVPSEPGGVHTYATFTWGQLYGNGFAWYNFSGLTVTAPDLSVPLNVLTACTYANGAGYRFTYGDWAIISKIETLSSTSTTRSYVQYNYPLASAGALTDAPTYTQQTISPDGATSNLSTWSYATTKAGTGVVTSMAITDPNLTTNTTNLDPNTGLTSSVQVKDSSNNLLRETDYSWTTSGASTVLGGTTTILKDSGQQSSVTYAYDSYGNATNVSEYDFGSVLKRQTVTTYATGPYIAQHILNLPTQVLVENGAGTIASRNDFAYDTTAITAITGASNHDDQAYGAAFTTRGNLTSVTRYSNAAAGTGPVIQTFSYDMLGNQRVAQLDCCNQKTFNFSSATQFSYPDSVVRGPSVGPQFGASYTYDSDKGLLLSSTDENGQQTQYQYDSMGRQILVLLPPQNGTRVQVNTAYDDAAVSPAVTGSSTANSAVTVTTLDGLGHVMQVDSKNASSVVSTVKYGYDKLWQRTQASNPYAPNEAVVNTTSSYDALGRVTQVAPPSQGSTQYQYSGNTVTIIDPAGKPRKNYTDALGRLIEVDEPGWGDGLPATGSVTISGSEASSCRGFLDDGSCIGQFWDTGTVSIVVNGVTKSYSYGSLDTPNTIASGLAAAFHNDGTAPADASVSGSTVVLTARTAGAAGNSYLLSASACTDDPNDFGGAPSCPSNPPAGSGSFQPSTSGGTLTGGQDGVSQNSLSLSRPLVTTYGYDLLDNLTSVSQAAMQHVNGQSVPGQPRSYVYDSLGRIASVTTPESGTVTTYYTDSSGHVCAGDPTLPCRTQDARGIVKTFTYDGINRVTGMTYSDGTPSVTYQYDAGGAAAFALNRMIKITEGPNSQAFTYDNFGRVTQVNQVITGNLYSTQYAYNLAGQTTSITYNTGRVVTQNFDPMGRPSSISDGSTTYLNNLSYNAAGQTLGYTLGNGVQGSFGYNDHLQLASLRYSNGSGSLKFVYDYATTNSPGNNGQIQAEHYFIGDVEDLTKSENFTYDNLGRLSAAQTRQVDSTPGTWSLQWGYDQLGNRLSQTLIGGNVSVGQPNFQIDPATNRIIGYCYDAAGNLLDQATCPSGGHTYTYDGANRLTQINGGSATYTYFGPLRIKKVNAGVGTVYIYSDGKPIVEYVDGALSKEYIYAGSQLLATIAGGNTTYHHPDHLSNRFESDASGKPVRSFGHFPYGETWYENGTADKWKFTSYERDSGSGETGLDYAEFRYLGTSQGRFMSPDPLAGVLGNPQSLNRYAYVSNDPVDLVDPTGLHCETTHYKWTEYNSDGTVQSVVEYDVQTCTPDLNWGFSLSSLAFLFRYMSPAPVLGGAPWFTPLDSQTQKKYDKNRSKLIDNLINNKDCIKWLLSHGIDPTMLALQAMQQNAYSGNSSVITMTEGGVGNNANFPGQTVADFFATNPLVNAVSQPGGNNVFFRNGNHVGVGTIGHETTHNYLPPPDTYDPNLLTQFGLPQGPSISITNKFNQHCNH